MKLLVFICLLIALCSSYPIAGNWNVEDCPSGCCCPGSPVNIEAGHLGYTASWTWAKSTACTGFQLYGSTFKDYNWDDSDYSGTWSDEYNNGQDDHVKIKTSNGQTATMTVFMCSVTLEKAV